MSLPQVTFTRSYAPSAYDCAICLEEHEAHTPIARHVAHQRASDGENIIHQFCLHAFRGMIRHEPSAIRSRHIACPICKEHLTIHDAIISTPLDLQETIDKVKNRVLHVRELTAQLKNEYEIALAAVTGHGFDLCDLSQELRNNKNIVRAAITSKAHNGRALMYAGESMRDDEEIVLAAVLDNPSALEFASERLKNNRNIVEAAISQECPNYSPYLFVGSELKNERSIILMALQHDGKLLKHLPAALNDDEEMVTAAVKHRGWALEYASDTMKMNKAVVLAAVENGLGHPLKFADHRFRGDRDVVLASVKTNGYTISYATEEIQNDPEIVMEAVRSHGDAISCCPRQFLTDKPTVLAAVRQSGKALRYIPSPLRNDKEILLAAIENHPQVFEELIEYRFRIDRDITLAAVSRAGYLIKYTSPELQKDKTIALLAVKNSRFAFDHIDYSLRNDPDLIAAFQTHPDPHEGLRKAICSAFSMYEL
jgi:hypothetical protein